MLAQEGSAGVEQNSLESHGLQGYGHGSKQASLHGWPRTMKGIRMGRALSWRAGGLAGALCVLVACSVAPKGPKGSERAADTSPAQVEIARAREATRLENWTLAAPLWQRVLTSNPDAGAEASLETARAMIELGNIEDARSVLEVGLQGYPKDGDLHELNGNALERLGFRRAAESSYLRAMAIEADRMSTLLALGRLRLELDMHAGALSALKRRISLGAADPETLFLAGEAFRGCGHYAKAFATYRQALAGADATAQRLVRAASLYEQPCARAEQPHFTELCRPWLERAVERDPQHTYAHYLLGMIHEDSGEIELARAAYTRSVETDPSCLRSLNALAHFLFDQEDFLAARDAASRALELEPLPTLRAELERIASR
jgi:tetratricopeptide (TPR) repeat protein